MARFNRIELDVPAHWQDSSTIQLTEPPSDCPIPGSILLMRTELDPQVTAESVGQAIIQGLKSGFVGCDVHTSKVTEIGGLPAHEVDFQWSTDGGQAFRRLQAIVVNGRESLIVTCTGLASGYDRYEPMFRKALSSLRLLPVPA
ncbi:MAG: DcrB [Armatimonadetes bacterium]|jgi:hypothetical protein|nr:DcrB [Armatimonadota bacterium]